MDCRENRNTLCRALSSPEVADQIIAGNPLAEDALKQIKADAVRSVPEAEEFVLRVPCAMDRATITDVLDLRLPEARSWLMHFICNPPEDFHGACLHYVASQVGLNLSELQTDHWGRFVHIFGDTSFGGNEFTELLGSYLRCRGASGLVYPSARNDDVSLIKNGRLSFFYGWNFVDYRGAGRPKKWRAPAVKPRLRMLDGHVEVLDARQGDEAGSVEMKGNLLRTREANENAYFAYVVAQGGKARTANGGTIWVRGFHWFRRRYTLLDSGFHAGCEKCDFTSTDWKAVTRSLSCLKCGYYGDL